MLPSVRDDFFNKILSLWMKRAAKLLNAEKSGHKIYLLCVCAQNETFLCHRFTRFVMKYNLMSKDNLIVPILEEEVQNTSSAGESEA